MKIKDKIWDEKIHWFKFKFRLIFFAIGILFTILKILEVTIWSRSFVITMIFVVLELIFYGMFFAPLIATHATGTPLGICTMESRESSPPKSLVFIGTVITGQGV